VLFKTILRGVALYKVSDAISSTVFRTLPN